MCVYIYIYIYTHNYILFVHPLPAPDRVCGSSGALSGSAIP